MHPAVIKIKPESVDVLLAVAKIRSNTHLAYEMGLSRQTVWRIRTGQSALSVEFLAGLLRIAKSTPGKFCFFDLFEIAEPEAATA